MFQKIKSIKCAFVFGTIWDYMDLLYEVACHSIRSKCFERGVIMAKEDDALLSFTGMLDKLGRHEISLYGAKPDF